MLRINKLGIKGDTIIEVMIAIVIISGVLAGTFAITNRSQKTTQANHERFQAQLYLNQQAELIKKTSALNRDGFINSFALDKDFCMDSGTENAQFDVNNLACNKDGLYRVTVTAVVGCSTIQIGCVRDTYNTFLIKIVWDSLNGQQDQVELAYGI